ncbi:MAG TPA: hypothetical protein V6C97_30595 [Oculatellaceae cyanobacterium]
MQRDSCEQAVAVHASQNGSGQTRLQIACFFESAGKNDTMTGGLPNLLYKKLSSLNVIERRKK